jgi:hypothetical protein
MGQNSIGQFFCNTFYKGRRDNEEDGRRQSLLDTRSAVSNTRPTAEQDEVIDSGMPRGSWGRGKKKKLDKKGKRNRG